MTSIDYTDLLNIKAISLLGTRISKIIEYWDTYDRSYPKFVDFINSIKKLESLGAIKINERGLNGKISNTLYLHMKIGEKIKFFINPSDKLILTVLERIEIIRDVYGQSITETDYESIIREYYTQKH